MVITDSTIARGGTMEHLQFQAELAIDKIEISTNLIYKNLILF
jgi:hypothetical protein